MILLMLRSDAKWVVLLIAVAWLLFKNLSGRLAPIWAAFGGLFTLALFLFHKLPYLGASAGFGSVDEILTAIGFSYVTLRLLDAGRAIREGRQRPPDLPSTINYLLPFHMLAAGPIQSYDEFVTQSAVPAPLSTSPPPCRQPSESRAVCSRSMSWLKASTSYS